MSGGGRKDYKRVVLADDRDPWERQPNEPDGAWAAFTTYRDLDPSVRRTLHPSVIEKHTRKVERWAPQWRWVQRAQAWDSRVDREAREASLKAVREMREKHIKIAQTMQGLGVTELSKAIKRSKTKPDELTITVREAVDIAERGVRLERLNRGEPETTHEETQRTGMTWSQIVDMRARQRAAEESE